MKTRSSFVFFGICIGLICGAAAGQLRPTVPATAPTPPAPPTPPVAAPPNEANLFLWQTGDGEGSRAADVAGFPGPVTWRSQNEFFGERAGRTQAAKLGALKALWDDAKNDADKDRVRDMLNALLSEEFEEGLNQQQAELKAIEERVERLRTRLRKRTDSKQEIVGLQARQVIMGWEGLGWRDPAANGSQEVRIGALNLNPFAAAGDRAGAGALKTLLLEAVEAKKTDEARLLLKSYLQRLNQNPPQAINNEVWDLYEQSRAKMEDPEYWNELVAALEALQGKDDPSVLDTLAHLKREMGDLQEALKYQRRAVELLQKRGRLFEPPVGVERHRSRDIEAYLKTLEQEVEADGTR